MTSPATMTARHLYEIIDAITNSGHIGKFEPGEVRVDVTIDFDRFASMVNDAIASALLAEREGEWLPIESAPKAVEGGPIVRVLATFPNGRVDIVVWTFNLSNPGGYWTSHIMEAVRGERWMREHQPIMFRFLPPPPAALTGATP